MAMGTDFMDIDNHRDGDAVDGRYAHDDDENDHYEWHDEGHR